MRYQTKHNTGADGQDHSEAGWIRHQDKTIVSDDLRGMHEQYRFSLYRR